MDLSATLAAALEPAPLHPCPALPAGVPVPPAPAVARAFWLRAADGLRLRAALWAGAAPRATLLLFPGRTEFVEKYHTVAARLAARGLAVLAIDWRGQGASDRLLADRAIGHVEDFAAYQRDVAALVAAAETLALPRPWHLLAHSMGGAIGLRALHGGLPVRSASLSAPMLGIALGRLPHDLATPLERLAAGLACRLGLAERPLPEGGAADPAPPDALFARNLLTSDRGWWDWMEELNAARPELVVTAPSFGWVRAALAECRALARLPMPALPALISVSGAERIVSATAIRRGAARWSQARLLELPGARHEALFEQEGNREALLSAVKALIDARG